MHEIWSIKISPYIISDWPDFPSSVCSCNSINMDGTLMRKAMQAEPENYVGQTAAGQYWTWGTRSRGTTILFYVTLFDPVYFINLIYLFIYYLFIYFAFNSQYETVFKLSDIFLSETGYSTRKKCWSGNY